MIVSTSIDYSPSHANNFMYIYNDACFYVVGFLLTLYPGIYVCNCWFEIRVWIFNLICDFQS